MKLRQKLVLSVFLCLSFAMIVVAIIRISPYHSRRVRDVTWLLFWQHIEGCIALIMASVTILRTAFVTAGHKRDEKKKKEPSYSIRQRLMAKIKRDRSDDLEDTELDLPTIPRATLTGMRTFIHRNNRLVGESAVMRSEYDRLEEGRPKGTDMDPDVDSQTDVTLQSRTGI